MSTTSNSITFRVNQEQMRLIDNYAKIQGEPLSKLVREAILEKIEDAMDYAAGEAAWKEHLKNPQTISMSQLKKHLGL
jgi:predicted DNA-binding protein